MLQTVATTLNNYMCDNQKQCKTCGEFFDLENFRLVGKFRRTDCRKCENDKRKKHYHTVEKHDEESIKKMSERGKTWRKNGGLEVNRIWRNTTDKGYWNNKIAGIKSNCKARKLECSITVAVLEKVYEEQGGKCVITGRELLKTREESQLDTCSVDRIDNSKGYVEGNIRLITLQANTAKLTGDDEGLLAFCLDVIQHLQQPSA